jgi:hypothetical protein
MIGQKTQMKSAGLVLEAVVYIHSPKILLTKSCSLPWIRISARSKCETSFATRGASMRKEAPTCTFPVSSWSVKGFLILVYLVIR